MYGCILLYINYFSIKLVRKKWLYYILCLLISVMVHNDFPKTLYHAFIGNVEMFSLVKYSRGLKNKTIIAAVNY